MLTVAEPREASDGRHSLAFGLELRTWGTVLLEPRFQGVRAC